MNYLYDYSFFVFNVNFFNYKENCIWIKNILACVVHPIWLGLKSCFNYKLISRVILKYIKIKWNLFIFILFLKQSGFEKNKDKIIILIQKLVQNKEWKKN